jgi:hypothetical protein
LFLPSLFIVFLNIEVFYEEQKTGNKGWWSGSSGKNACLASSEALSSNLMLLKKKPPWEIAGINNYKV